MFSKNHFSFYYCAYDSVLVINILAYYHMLLETSSISVVIQMICLGQWTLRLLGFGKDLIYECFTVNVVCL